MTVSERVKLLCKEKGIPVSRLEKDLGFSNGYIGKLDKSNPNVTNLQKIAIYFDVSLDWLMGMKGQTRLYADGTQTYPIVKSDGTAIFPVQLADGSFRYPKIFDDEPETEQMPAEQARLIAHNMNNARETEKEKIKDVIDFYTDPATAEMMQKLFESPGRRALFNAVADMDEESVQKYADFIERITNDNHSNN